MLLHFWRSSGASSQGLYLLYRRGATGDENAALDQAAAATVAALALRGLYAEIVSERLNRRKIDLIPDWADPPKALIAELLDAVEEAAPRPAEPASARLSALRSTLPTQRAFPTARHERRNTSRSA